MYFYRHICWLSANLLRDFLTVNKFAGRFTDCHHIYWQKWGGVFLLADCPTPIKSASRNGEVFLLADFLTVTKPAGRFTDRQQIYWQKCGGGVFLWQMFWLPPNMLAAIPLKSVSFEQIFFCKAGRRMNTEVFHERLIVANGCHC